MPRTRIWPGRFGIAIALGVLLLAPRAGWPAPVPADQLRQEALEHERLGQWDKALEVYVKLLSENRQQPELRERLQYCVRRLHQVRRHQDAVFRNTILSLPVSQALAVYVEVLDKLNTQYVDRDKVPLDKLYQHGLDEFRAALSDPTFRQEHLAGVEPRAVAALHDRLSDEWSRPVIVEVRDARRWVRDLAWEAQRLTGLNPTVVILEFACGACNALDEYTVFLTPGQPFDDPTALSGELAIYGLLLNWNERQLVVERIIPDTWAASQGLQPGDRVTHIGRGGGMPPLPIDRTPLETITDLLRGDAGTIGELIVQPLGTTTSRILTLPTYALSVIDDYVRDSIGYIRLANFQKTTPQEMESALLSLRSKGMRVLVLDLRGNPGGLFPAAVQVADRFLPQGVIVTTQGQLRGVNKTFIAQNPLTAIDVPLVVLVDGDTASAAEVVAGALKDHQRALLIGETTYGKGSIQSLVPLQVGGGIRLTLARFYTPHGQPFASVGVTPHLFEPRRDFQLELAFEQAMRLLTMK